MSQTTQKRFDNVIAFAPAARRARFWSAQQQFGIAAPSACANENYAPVSCNGAQTSDLMLDFLYGVTRQAN